jgi:hypothetical protein
MARTGKLIHIRTPCPPCVTAKPNLGKRLAHMPKHRFILLIFTLGLAACSPPEHKASLSAHKLAASKSADSGHTPSPVNEVPGEGLFHGWMCNWDCSAHQAGYAWASTHKIVNPKDCHGPSQSFVEGCWAFTGVEGPFGQSVIFQDED